MTLYSSTGSRERRRAPSEMHEGKADKKKRMYDIQGLFEAVEQQDLELVSNILDSHEVDINSVNSDDMTVLEVAMLLGSYNQAQLLLSYGARENPKYVRNASERMELINTLISQAEQKLSDVQATVNTSVLSTGSTSSYSGQQKEKLAGAWEQRLMYFQTLLNGYNDIGLPDCPSHVDLSVSSSSSVLVTFKKPLSADSKQSHAVTKYMVEWSCFEDFQPVAGQLLIENTNKDSCSIGDLAQGNTYYVCVRAGNMKGFGPPAYPSPTFAIPSSWKDLAGMKSRSDGKLKQLNELFSNVRNSRPSDYSEIRDGNTPGTSPVHTRRSNVRKSIKNLFASAPKFQKALKRGVYMAALMYNGDRILLTNEEHLPIVEVDEHFTGTSLNADYHWLMKVACTWEDVKSLRQDMDRCSSAGAVQFRSKLLQAANHLQTTLGIQDLGQFYHEPLRFSNDCVVFVTVNRVQQPKSIHTMYVKWLAFSKLQRKMASADNLVSHEHLINSIAEMIHFHGKSNNHLTPGLYLGYLKLKSSVDQIRILAPNRSPNVLPHVKIRDQSNISKEEWEWVQKLGANESSSSPSTTQLNFQQEVIDACDKLLGQLGLTEDVGVSHRLYDIEVIELSEDISFLLLLPPIENVCSVPGHNEDITDQPDCLMLPVQVFEMTHMSTYQYDFIARYSRLSAILEMDMLLAQQAQREAFSSHEMSTARDRVEQLSGFQQKLDEVWKAVRWTIDIINYARDKSVRGGLPLGVLYASPPSPVNSPLPDILEFDVGTLSSCSDMGYHSDRSSVDDCRICGMIRDSEFCTCNTIRLPTESEEVWTRAQPGILRVFAAYETGLARGTSVKLHVTPRTTAREVINLVVQQLNRATLVKGRNGPVYLDEQLEDFCLVAIIGARERILREDYQPLQLQNPWTKGRLFVRLKHNILAALEQGQVTTV